MERFIKLVTQNELLSLSTNRCRNVIEMMFIVLGNFEQFVGKFNLNGEELKIEKLQKSEKYPENLFIYEIPKKHPL